MMHENSRHEELGLAAEPAHDAGDPRRGENMLYFILNLMILLLKKSVHD